MKFALSLYLLMVGWIWADEFPRLPNTESTTDADPPSAKESVKSFSLPEGTKVKVWASEPMVQNPIAMAWDQHGRMWVAENFTYGAARYVLI